MAMSYNAMHGLICCSASDFGLTFLRGDPRLRQLGSVLKIYAALFYHRASMEKTQLNNQL